MTPRITAAICTYNRADLLAGALESLLDQTLPKHAYEVLVVDNGSTDETPDVVRRYAETAGGATLRSCVAEPPGLSHARNTAVRMAKAEIVAFMDDDALASPRWLEALLEAYEAFPDAWAAGGRVEPLWLAPRPAWLTDGLLYGSLAMSVDLGNECRPLKPGEHVFGVNCSFRRRVFEDLGGFDTALGRKGELFLEYEETDLLHKVRNKGKDIVYSPEALVSHIIPSWRSTKRHFMKVAYGKGRTSAIVAWRDHGRTFALKKGLRSCLGTGWHCLKDSVFVHQPYRAFQCIYRLARLGGYLKQMLVYPHQGS